MNAAASRPMYNLPEMRAGNACFWAALRELLTEAGSETSTITHDAAIGSGSDAER